MSDDFLKLIRGRATDAFILAVVLFGGQQLLPAQRTSSQETARKIDKMVVDLSAIKAQLPDIERRVDVLEKEDRLRRWDNAGNDGR